MFMNCINFNNDDFRFGCIKKIDLDDTEFAKAINNNIGAFDFNDDCMRMSCLG